MPLIPFKKMLDIALRKKYVVGYFEAWNEDSLEAILCAAEEVHSPVILGFGSVMLDQKWFNGWGLGYFSILGKLAVKKSKVPTCLILNEAKIYEQCLKGIDLGFNVVMLDSSHLPFKENLEITKQLVSIAHSKGVGVEAELGHLPDANRCSQSSLTDPEEANQFVQETKIDALSVSVGNMHTLTKCKANIDFGLLENIRQATAIPLVIHGGTGFPEKAIRECIRLGVAKFNVGTILKKVYYQGIKERIEQISDNLNIQEMVGSRKVNDFAYKGRENIKREVKRLIKLYGSEGKI